MESLFLHLSKKIPKPLVARIIVLSDIHKYFTISYLRNITWLIYFMMEHGNIEKLPRSSAICHASKHGNLEIVKYLHASGVYGYIYETSICWACKKGHLDVVKYLYQNGADLNVRLGKPIRLASENGYLKIVKYLHRNGADIRAFYDAPICLACENGHLEIVKYLHRNGADIRADNNYPIKMAKKNGHYEIIKYIRELDYAETFLTYVE